MYRARASWFAILLCLGGCISVSTTSTGDFDYDKRFRKAADSIVDRSKQAEQEALKQRATVRDAVDAYLQHHFTKADELVSTHVAVLRKSLRHSGSLFSFFDDYGRRRATLLDFTLELRPSVEVVESKLATATAFPSGKVLVTRPLAEGFDTAKIGYDSVLLGVLMHEMIHVRDGHALEQWATADGRSAWARDRVLSGLSAITAIIPFFSVNYDVQYPLTFGAVKELPTLSEFAADLGAVSLMNVNGFDSARYVAFLSDLSASASASSGPGRDLLRKRVECLGEFSRTTYRQPIRVLVVGSSKDGDNMRWVNLPTEDEVTALLDSPELLAKNITSTEKMSDAKRREILVDQMRKWMFISCALRNSFPNAPLKDGVLSTPTFDSNILFQYQ
jgi:hypothetical protein